MGLQEIEAVGVEEQLGTRVRGPGPEDQGQQEDEKELYPDPHCPENVRESAADERR